MKLRDSKVHGHDGKAYTTSTFAYGNASRQTTQDEKTITDEQTGTGNEAQGTHGNQENLNESITRLQNLLKEVCNYINLGTTY